MTRRKKSRMPHLPGAYPWSSWYPLDAALFLPESLDSHFSNTVSIQIHTPDLRRRNVRSVKNSEYIFPELLPSPQPSNRHFLSVRNFSGTFWEPWHLLTGTGLQTEERQVSGKADTQAMPQLTRAFPATRGAQREKCPGSWGQQQCQTEELSQNSQFSF